MRGREEEARGHVPVLDFKFNLGDDNAANLGAANLGDVAGAFVAADRQSNG